MGKLEGHLASGMKLFLVSLRAHFWAQYFSTYLLTTFSFLPKKHRSIALMMIIPYIHLIHHS